MSSAAPPTPARAVFINLDRATERRRLMEGQAERAGLVLERFAAVEADALSDELVAARGRSWQRPLTKAELGCFLSHETLWQRVSDGKEPWLIMEDDVVLSPKLAELLALLPTLSALDFLNLESCDRRRFAARSARTLSPRLSIRRVFRDKSGSGAYVLWPEGARKLLDRARGGAEPVDAFLHGTRRMASFQAEPALAMQLHILERRGVPVPISSATFIQAPRRSLPLTLGNLRYHGRRLAAQLRLGLDHVSRLTGRRYRPTEVVEEDFAAASRDAGSALPHAAPSPQSRS